MEKLGYGIIGCGVIAPWHADSVRGIPNVKLVAVSDESEQKAKSMAEKYGVEYYTNYNKMLERDDIDLVSICTPSGFHMQAAVAAATAGKHIMCEKPLEITLEKCDTIIDACQINKVKLGVIFQRRTWEVNKKIKEAIDSGKLGKMILGDAYLKYYRNQEYYDSAGWRGTWDIDGGGCLMNQGVHGIDLIQWLMGPVESVYAYAETMARKIEVEDTAIALLRYKNGAIGVIQGATTVYPGLPSTFAIHGEKGTIVWEEDKIKTYEIIGEEKKIESAEDKSQVGISSSPTSIGIAGHKTQIADLIDAIINNRRPLCDGEEGRKAVEIILAIYKSAKNKQEVKLPLK